MTAVEVVARLLAVVAAGGEQGVAGGKSPCPGFAVGELTMSPVAKDPAAFFFTAAADCS